MTTSAKHMIPACSRWYQMTNNEEQHTFYVKLIKVFRGDAVKTEQMSKQGCQEKQALAMIQHQSDTFTADERNDSLPTGKKNEEIKKNKVKL